MRFMNEWPFLSMLICFRHLSTWPVQEVASKEFALEFELEDTELDQVANKRVVADCNLEEADCS